MKKSTRFFSTMAVPNRFILRGAFNYAETFSSFLRGTHQKQDTALVMGLFATKLREKKVILNQPQLLKVADFGCADSKSCLQYLKSMHYFPGFDYFGMDINTKFIKEAESTLSLEPLIKRYSLFQIDALCGNLKEKKEFMSQLFDFIFISHTAYYLKDKLACRAFLLDITKLLTECGIAIFLHEDSTSYFRSTYNKKQFKNISTPMLIEQSARVLKTRFNQFKSIRFISKLRFAPLSTELWEAIKYPNSYTFFADVPNFIETLEKLAFIVQRDLHSMASEGSLSDYVDNIKDAIAANNYCLDLETHMQTIVSYQCTLRHKIATALAETSEEIPHIFAKNSKDERKNDSIKNPFSFS